MQVCARPNTSFSLLQGYSLDSIIMSSTGGNTDRWEVLHTASLPSICTSIPQHTLSPACSHPVAVATKDVAAAAGAADPAALQQHLAALQQQFKGLSSSDLQQALAGTCRHG